MGPIDAIRSYRAGGVLGVSPDCPTCPTGLVHGINVLIIDLSLYSRIDSFGKSPTVFIAREQT